MVTGDHHTGALDIIFVHGKSETSSKDRHFKPCKRSRERDVDSILARAFPNCVTLDKFLPAPVTPRVDEIMISKEALSPVNASLQGPAIIAD